MTDTGRPKPSDPRANGENGPDDTLRIDAATLRAAARSVHGGAWLRTARREGWTRGPGVASAFGILAILACLAVGGGVFLPRPFGMFRNGVRSAAVRAGDPADLESPSGMENGAMRAKMFMTAGAAGALFLGSNAWPQTAVEWKSNDGGNGHWYQAVTQTGDWIAASASAAARGGHLATITSQAEQTFLASIGAARYWLGGYAPTNQGCGPTAWLWITGEPMTFRAWASAEPGSPCGHTCMAFAIWGGYSGGWNNDSCTEATGPGFMMEWEADCNGDGIVDYGQIRSGELADADANNIPDCCEQGTDCPTNLAVNGGFEAGTPLNACTSETVTSGNALGTGWMVTAGSVERVRTGTACTAQTAPRAGDFLVDLLSAGEIRQAVATTPGRSYRLTFWLSGDCAGGPSTKRVTASLGATSTTFDHACVGTGAQAWRSCTVEFIANAAITTLSLKSAAGGATNGPLIDGVRVEDISISCPGDVDGDGAVTGGDIGLVLLNFGDCPSN